MSQQINLFNPIFLKQKKTFSAVNMLDALALLVVGVALFYGYASIQSLSLDRQLVETSRQYEQAKALLAQASVRYAPKTIDVGLEAEVSGLQAQVAARKATLDSLSVDALGSGASYAEYLRALARQSLPGLWLTRFRVAGGDTEMEIVGRALRPELVPAYIERLNQEKALRGREFDSLSMTQLEGVLPANAPQPAGAPAKYSYTEFQLLSSHAGFSAGGKPVARAKAAIELPAGAPGNPVPNGGSK